MRSEENYKPYWFNGARLRAMRLARPNTKKEGRSEEMTQDELAAEIGVSPATINELESGKRKWTTTNVLFALSEFFEVPSDFFRLELPAFLKDKDNYMKQ